MSDIFLLSDLVSVAAERTPDAVALTYGHENVSYGSLQARVASASHGLLALGLKRGERVAVFLEKRVEMVVACFGCALAGGVFVPVNPVLRPEQVAHILRDCDARVLVTSADRLSLLDAVLPQVPGVRHIVLTDGDAFASAGTRSLLRWTEFLSHAPRAAHRVIDGDVLSILYTSGSTGRPKGVVLSHRNMVSGAQSVSGYLGNRHDDTLIAVLPLSFDAGFSQLTTAFRVGARVVLLNPMTARDVLKTMSAERVTGITAVPPLYFQLAQLQWPSSIDEHLRYFANTGGRMPRDVLESLRARVPRAKPFLMYGLTEAFRSTYLPPEEVDRRPDSIGKAIPNAEILVLREDGSDCEPGEPGELVHRGALVGLGYWNDAERTAERYKALRPASPGSMLPEYAVFSGDVVKRDDEGFLYFIGRRDEMIKSSGYRISPTEVEEIVFATRLVGECAAFGVEHDRLGQAIHVVVTPPDGVESADVDSIMAACKKNLPAYMVPSDIRCTTESLPRNPNGKIDRLRLVSMVEAAAASAT